MSPDNNRVKVEIGCFGCVFWLALFAAFCMVLLAGLQWLARML